MSASNNSTNDTLLAEFYMDDFNRRALQDKRALEARNNTTASAQPNTEEKVAEKKPFDTAAFFAWAKGPVQKEEQPINNNKKPDKSSFRLETF